MEGIVKFLDGKKSYIGALIVGAVGAGVWAGVIDQKTAEIILAFGTMILGIGLKSAITKAAPNA